MVKERSEVPLEDRWKVEALYPSFEAWEAEFKPLEMKRPRFPELLSFKGSLGKSPSQLAQFFEKSFNADRLLSKLYTYAHLMHDVDLADETAKNAYGRIVSLISDFREETSWVEPEILHLSDEKIKTFLTDKALEPYHIYLEKIVRLKPHTLSEELETLLAQTSLALETPGRAFTAFANADLKFPCIRDGQGKELELTEGKYGVYLRSQDRVLRETAFKNLLQTYRGYENTICELIQGEVQSHVLGKRARNYKSCLESALFPHQIDTSVYRSLIETARKHLGSLQRYIGLRKKWMGVSELHFWDLYVPLVKEVDFTMEYQKAVDQIVSSVAILGKEYQKTLEIGLNKDRWVDRYENARKRKGAYSSGCYDSMPYILMNYHSMLSDVLTLAHEAGHSMHSFLSGKHQPYHYSHYSIFVAEVASTFNEELLLRLLLSQVKTKDERCFLINQKIEDIRATFFRQVMFAEFELQLHEWVEQGTPLTPALLKKAYRKLNEDYFGKEFIVDDELEIEWARIPHFYNGFYVYQYATGISAANALVERVLKEGDPARDAYLEFLSSGSSRYPLDLLARAGVDMRKPQAVEAMIHRFDELVDQLEREMKS